MRMRLSDRSFTSEARLQILERLIQLRLRVGKRVPLDELFELAPGVTE